MEARKMAHRFTEAEEARMAKFESIEYWNPNTRLYRDNVDEMKRRGRGQKWVVYALIGMFVGLFAFMLLNTIALLSKKRRKLFESALGSSEWYGSNWGAFLIWLSFSVVLVGASTGLCGLWPHAAGSGVPDVMAYLNGVTFPKVFNLKTLLSKLFSCALAVAGGLPCGPEGPMIHIGALIGAGLGTGRSRTLKTSLKLLEVFRNPRDHRDFITGGACAGVACAFSAPIGGLLFVVEEMSSFFSKKALWMAFFSSLVAIFTVNTLTSKFEGWQLRENVVTKCTAGASWNSEYTILFKANSFQDVNLLSVPFVVILGIICGLFGTLFTFMNIKVARFRMHRINKSTKRRMLEPIVILVLFMTTMFALVVALPCKSKPPFDLNAGTNGTGSLEYFDKICTNPREEYHPFGTLVFASAEETVKLLLRRGMIDERTTSNTGFGLFSYETLVLWFCVYFIFACWCAGTYLSSGLVIPMLIMGSALGRFYGLAISDVMEKVVGENCLGVDAWVDPGVFALYGAAGFFAGVSRLSFSLCVIIVEITGDIPHLPNVMICAMVAKQVADFFTHPLYHALLELRCVPFLDFDVHLPYLDCYTARDLIRANGRLVTLNTKETVANVVRCLYDNPHNAFPIVSHHPEFHTEGAGILRGTVLRSTLEEMLWYLDDCDRQGLNPELDYTELVRIREKMFWERQRGPPWKDAIPEHLAGRTLDLIPLTNTSAFSIPDSFSVSASYYLFRGMGLRHVVVVNKFNSVVGMLTRKDLVGHAILKNTMESQVALRDDLADDVSQENQRDPTHSMDGHSNSFRGRVPSERGLHAYVRATRAASSRSCTPISDAGLDPLRSLGGDPLRSIGGDPTRSLPREYSTQSARDHWVTGSRTLRAESLLSFDEQAPGSHTMSWRQRQRMRSEHTPSNVNTDAGDTESHDIHSPTHASPTGSK
eukprot:TRINITY_DN27731_c0_g1_i1.p1 TRINITY_DN27731_c0_g1~~TRINITY_DN27731_c0_g1_i1.p1  ORF type:complete len:1026 (+),score=383.43 TRINITY_DN27731_c0_g1_i1:274-3078(+)